VRTFSITAVEVELDIFSGMPNPVWTLADAQSSAFVAKLSALRGTEARPRSDGLGYRGLIVRIRQGTGREVRVRGGLVEIIDGSEGASTFLSDPDRGLERWLLSTGRRFVDDHIFRRIDVDR